MKNETIYHTAGACGLLAMGLFFIELPMYLSRGPMPVGADASYSDYAARNAVNMLFVVALDVLICSLLLTFLGGFRHLIRQTHPGSMWLATQVFGAGVVYSTITLFMDVLQAPIAIDELRGHSDPSLIRAFLSGRHTALLAMSLIFSAVLLAAASYISQSSRTLPRISAWFGYCGAVLCLILVPAVAMEDVHLSAFLQSTRWGAASILVAVPLLLWIGAAAVSLVRMHAPQNPVPHLHQSS